MTSKIGTKWSEDDIAMLIELISTKTPVPKIADVLQRCEKGVRSKAYSLGLKFK